ncbi:hypothetical protein JN403_04975 [Pseudomonas sp. 15A4]|jgi:hypothetical protein|uniref:Uncharacterized protein n=1 Tax=Pseudomonas graminis TaxID=158627 RepID=A0A6M8MTD7_9PSED|nr:MULTISPECIES: hypothetical protein [Pseudomonas]MDC6383449.1 hypothetical protein [Pseudomonas graminis]QKF50477.1 hypothetical protein FX982_01421 [Pseudomonas graminis]QSB20345.1 hypothetical protein JN403_04975 [Pseudomonas sp. 15A4]
MNAQHLANKLRISPLHLQQVLFASLALMITLIVVQQFNHWNQNQEVTQVHYSHAHTAPFAKASALKASDVALSMQVDDAAATPDEAPRQQSWVF